MLLWWCVCDGLFEVLCCVMVCLRFCVVVVVCLWWCVCGGVFVVVCLWWCVCGGVFVVVCLWWCVCGESGNLGGLCLWCLWWRWWFELLSRNLHFYFLNDSNTRAAKSDE